MRLQQHGLQDLARIRCVPTYSCLTAHRPVPVRHWHASSAHVHLGLLPVLPRCGVQEQRRAIRPRYQRGRQAVLSVANHTTGATCITASFDSIEPVWGSDPSRTQINHGLHAVMWHAIRLLPTYWHALNTVPLWLQVYINGEFVGGSDLLMGLHQSGELEKLVQEENVKS